MKKSAQFFINKNVSKMKGERTDVLNELDVKIL